jgi:hypothetical protein
MEKFNVGSDFAVAVGGEWYSYSGQELILNFPIALLAMIVGYVLFSPRYGKLPEKATFFLTFVTILLAAQFRSKRFAEYFPPFAILFAGFSLQAFFAPPEQTLPEEFTRDLQPFFDVEKIKRYENFLDNVRLTVSLIFFAAFGILCAYNFAGIAFYVFQQEGLSKTIRANEPNTKYQLAMEWAVQNIPAGERIFNCNWDDFPKMFYYDQKHTYVYGLDPNYLYSANPDLYKFVKDVTEGKIEDPGPQIREKLNARYVFSDAKENTDMIASCLDSGWCETAYDDDEAIILKIRDEKGEPPTTETSDDADADNAETAGNENDANDENADSGDNPDDSDNAIDDEPDGTNEDVSEVDNSNAQ